MGFFPRRMCRWVTFAALIVCLFTLLEPLTVSDAEDFPTKRQKKKNVDDNNRFYIERLYSDVNQSNRNVKEKSVKQLLKDMDIERDKQTDNDGKVRARKRKNEKFPYRYLINEKNVCSDEIQIINLIPVAPMEEDQRNMIRNMWGNSTHASLTKMRTLFIIGTTNSTQLQRNLERESDKFHDIVQLDFVDSYANLTLKTLSILHWSIEYCPSAKWILKSDVDVLVNSFGLSNFLLYKRWPRSMDLICQMNENLLVCRKGDKCNQKWALTRQEYPDDFYPPYCNGPAYILSSNFAKRLYKKALNSTLFVIEDVYYTGILAKDMNPKYLALPYKMFPNVHRKIKEYYWNGHALMFLNLQEFEINFSMVWSMIAQYENIEFSGY